MSMMPMSIGAYANPGSFGGMQLPTLNAPNLQAPQNLSSGAVGNALEANQSAANQQNQQLYQGALNTEANASTNQQASIQQAMQANAGYGQSQLSNLGVQLQQQLGANTQSNVSRGLGNTTLAQSSQAPILNNYNQSVAGVNNQAANVQAGLASNLASAQMQGANTLANTIASANNTAPNAAQFAQLNQQANSNPGQITGYQFQAPTPIAGAMNKSAPSYTPPSGIGGTDQQFFQNIFGNNF